MRQGEGETRRHGEPASGHVGPPSGVEPLPSGLEAPQGWKPGWNPARRENRPPAQRGLRPGGGNGERSFKVRGAIFTVRGARFLSLVRRQAEGGRGTLP